jgi:hypothetical protein
MSGGLIAFLIIVIVLLAALVATLMYFGSLPQAWKSLSSNTDASKMPNTVDDPSSKPSSGE